MPLRLSCILARDSDENRTICRWIAKDCALVGAGEQPGIGRIKAMNRGTQSRSSLACMIEEERESLLACDRLHSRRLKRQLEQKRGACRFRGFLGAFSTGDPLYAGASGELGTESAANADLWSWETEKECSASLSAGVLCLSALKKQSHTL